MPVLLGIPLQVEAARFDGIGIVSFVSPETPEEIIQGGSASTTVYRAI